MLRKLLQRWSARRSPEAGRRAAPPAPPAARIAPLPPPVPAAPRPPSQPLVAFGARRPLIDGRGQIAGFEFRVAEPVLARLRRRGDTTAVTAHASALFAAMRLTAASGRLAYTELPPGWLGLPKLAQEVSAGLLISIPAIEAADAFDEASCAAIDTLRAAGARIGWAGLRPQSVASDFVVLRGGADIVQAQRRHLVALATDLATVDDLEAALRAGVRWAACTIAPRAEPRDAQPIAPQVRRVCNLLNRVLREAETAPIVAEIKADVGLSYRLLHQLQMAGVGGGRVIESIEHAVMLFGRDHLYRWLSMLLIRFAADRPAALALQEIALARARLFELLARERREPAPESLFTLGLASMLSPLLQLRIEEAIEPLQLPAPARQALLAGEGPWQAYLAIAAELENPGAAPPRQLAEAFGGLEIVLERSAEAWQWAAEATGSSQPQGEHA